jgi:hypothetical protein
MRSKSKLKSMKLINNTISMIIWEKELKEELKKEYEWSREKEWKRTGKQ